MATDSGEENKNSQDSEQEDESAADTAGEENKQEDSEAEEKEDGDGDDEEEEEDGDGDDEEESEVSDVEEEEAEEEEKEDGDGDDDEEEEDGDGDVEEENEDSDGEEEEEEAGEEKAMMPSKRSVRERKQVDRYMITFPPSKASTSKPLAVAKGSGAALKDIPNVAFKLSKRKPDDNLQLLHTILFGKKAKVHNLKKDIGKFSGFIWTENEEKQRTKVKNKLDKCIKEKLVDFCDVLNIPINKAMKEALCLKILLFLESPHATTDVLLADKEQKGTKHKRKGTPSKSPSSLGSSGEKSVKKQKTKGKSKQLSSKSSETDITEAKAGSSSNKAKVKSEAQKDTAKDQEDKSKQPSSKSSATATTKEQAGDWIISKKEKAQPSKQQLFDAVVNILKEIDINAATFSDLLGQLGTHFGLDLTARKNEVKKLVLEAMSDMVDEDDGDE